MRQVWLFCAVAWVGVVALPGLAHAQYKNKAFGFDIAYELVQKPPITDATGVPLPINSRGDRLGLGIRFGGEGIFKLHADHWWFAARPIIGFYKYFSGDATGNYEQQADALASANIGTMLDVGALAGVRYYFLTDHFRPYLQLSLSYEHLFTFGGAGSTCTDPALCAAGGTYGDNFLPHSNILAVHAAPSFEVIIKRDLALHFMLDYARWIVFNGYGNNVFTFGFGVLFYG